MIDVLVIILVIGLVASSLMMKTAVDPFFIYFSSWLFVFLTYYFFQDTYIEPSSSFLEIFLISKIFALSLLGIQVIFPIKKIKKISVSPVKSRATLISFSQAITIICMPLVYFKAFEMNGGINIFSIDGYRALRLVMTDGGMSYGLYAYVMTIAYVISSIRFFEYIEKKQQLLLTIISILTSLFYVYLSTGRTYGLLLLILIFTPCILIMKIRGKGLVALVMMAPLIFLSITIMTAKGVSVDSDFIENLRSLTENLRGYISAPILAFSKLFDSFHFFEYGQNSFRTLISALNALGIIEQKPIELIRAYEFVPDATNVYSVYEVYFRDFYLLGMFIPPLFLILHFWLYKNAIEVRGKWVFYYSVSLYPLLMQFFQDQYFSLISMLIQITFWYTVFIKSDSQFSKFFLSKKIHD